MLFHDTRPLLTDEQWGRMRSTLLTILVRRSYLYRATPFRLRSGGESHHYVDGRQTALTADGAFFIARLFHHLIHLHAPSAVAIGGLTFGADPLVSAVVTLSQFMRDTNLTTGFYVRKEQKGHGVNDLVVGANHLPSGAPVVICDDVITSGGSMIEAIAGAEREPRAYDVRLCLALVDRGENDGLARIRSHVPRAFALFTLDDLIKAHEELE